MPAAYFLFALRSFGTTPQRRAGLLAGTGVDPTRLGNSTSEITLGQQLRQIRNANRLLGPEWPLEHGASLEASAHGPLGVAAISAPTLADSLLLLSRYSRCRNPAVRMAVVREGASTTLVLGAGCRLAEEEQYALMEVFALSLFGIVALVLGEPPHAATMELSRPRPGHADRYARYFPTPVHFGRPRTAIVFPRAWESLACPFADPALFETSRRMLEGSARRLEAPEFFAARVEHVLASGGPAGLSKEQVAQRLGTSPRTLVRRLQAHGLSFRELRDAHRRTWAGQLLRVSGQTTEQIAFDLGYRDAANFRRACRRWFGTAPGEARAAPAT